MLKVDAIKCDCRTTEEENKTKDHLRLVIRISALKLLPAVREIIYQSEAEKSYLLLRAKYEILKDLRVNYGNLLAETNIVPSIDVLVDSIKAIMNNNQSLGLKEMHSLVTRSVSKFHTNVLPTTFLCFTLGTCRNASSLYMNCMRNSVQRWTTFLGDDMLNMSKVISDHLASSSRRASPDNVKESHADPAQAFIMLHEAIWSKNVLDNLTKSLCVRNVLTDDSVGYCRIWLKKWDTNVDELYQLTKNYKEGFEKLIKGVANSFRRLAEIKAPRLARIIRKATKAERSWDKYREKLVEQMLQLRKCWQQIAERMCSAAVTEQSYCWNGTNIVRTQLASDDFTIETKDVRPRPKFRSRG
ncbi:hypothetical protein KIN20_029518 [Parelaphostrongylus tenuis]|uniref:Uncharacterized protein n=1 Tax=Parelaphostrongylus tenuis TaxID=148309 RepID=A0AAD5R2R3_PARTN|nr:hypothetical protein KIN20_029518 [Parelaphostrongylus tenuis]